MSLAKVEQQIKGPQHTIWPVGFIPGEVVQLTEDDVHAHGVDEPDHHRVRDPTQEGAEFEETGNEHDHSGDDGQREQRPVGIVGRMNHRDVGNDDRHRPGGLDRHE